MRVRHIGAHPIHTKRRPGRCQGHSRDHRTLCGELYTHSHFLLLDRPVLTPPFVPLVLYSSPSLPSCCSGLLGSLVQSAGSLPMAVRMATVMGSLPARTSAAAAVLMGSKVSTRTPLGFCVSATSEDHSCAVTSPSTILLLRSTRAGGPTCPMALERVTKR